MTPLPAGAAAPRTAPGPGRAPVRRPVGPRRVSGPARRPAAPVPPLRRVVDHPLLDRLVRGRTWIGIVAFALIGIVTMEVALLKLNAGIGRSVEQASTLQRANSLLAAQVSALQASNLQQAEVAGQGMVFDPPGDVRYLTAGNADAAAAAEAMVAPGAGTPSTSTTAGPTSIAAGSTATQTTAATSSPASTAGQAQTTTTTTTAPATTSSPVLSSAPQSGGGAAASTPVGASGAAVSSSTSSSSGVAGGAVAGG